MSLPTLFRYVEAARELYAAEGPEGVSVRKLGKRLGLSPAALYRHFRTRADLLDSVASNGFVAASAYIHRHRAVRPARARLWAITADAIDYALGSPRLFKLIFDEARKPGVVQEVLLRYVENTIREAAKEEPGIIGGHQPHQLARGWLALIVGAVALHRSGVLDEAALRELCARCAGRVLGVA